MEELSTTSLEIAEQKTEASPSQLADGPLYVVGIWRSGTSLFYALLNQHPQIALTYEDDLVFLRPIFWLPRKTASWLARWDFFNGAIIRHKIDPSRIPENISDLKTASDAVHIEYARQKKTATIWGCKSPTYFDMLSEIGATFPKAKFIIIWRDLRGICRSIAKAAEQPSFFRRKGITLRALLGYRQMKLQCDRLLADGAPVYQIYYEDLVSDPAAVMKGVCEFLQIPFDKRMTLLEGADRSAIDDGKHHSMVKSTAIRGVRDRSDNLSPALDAKIDRYSRLWREQEGGNWPAYPERPEGDLSKPSIWEFNYDRICYWALWFSYYMIPVVYSFVPLSLWQTYRKFRNKSFSWEKLEKDASSD
jgi:hypothetical protein